MILSDLTDPEISELLSKHREDRELCRALYDLLNLKRSIRLLVADYKNSFKERKQFHSSQMAILAVNCQSRFGCEWWNCREKDAKNMRFQTPVANQWRFFCDEHAIEFDKE